MEIKSLSLKVKGFRCLGSCGLGVLVFFRSFVYFWGLGFWGFRCLGSWGLGVLGV